MFNPILYYQNSLFQNFHIYFATSILLKRRTAKSLLLIVSDEIPLKICFYKSITFSRVVQQFLFMECKKLFFDVSVLFLNGLSNGAAGFFEVQQNVYLGADMIFPLRLCKYINRQVSLYRCSLVFNQTTVNSLNKYHYYIFSKTSEFHIFLFVMCVVSFKQIQNPTLTKSLL